MPVWLHTIIIIYSFLLIFNAIFSFMFWKNDQNKLFFYAFISWTFNFLNFFIHGLSNTFGPITLLGHSLYYFSSVYLALILATSLNIKFNEKFYLKIYPPLIISSLLLYKFNPLSHPYFYSALILDIGLSIPIFQMAYASYKNREHTFVTKSFLIILLMTALHCLDYPFIDIIDKNKIIRGVSLFETLTAFGFSFAFFLSIVLSIILPLLIFEQKNKKYQKSLEDEVEQKTLELKYNNQKLEETNKDNLTLLSIMSHDLSNPLMIIDTHIKRILKSTDELPTLTNLSLQKIKLNIENISVLLKRVKEMHAARSGKIIIKKEQVSILPLLQETYEAFQERASEKNINITIRDKTTRNSTITIDPLLFKNQILGNLLTNAIKFSPTEGNIILEVFNSHKLIYISVIDQGPGIPIEKIPHLFKFDQATTTLGSKNEKGTGLGLPTVKILTEKMNGELFVDNIYDHQKLNIIGCEFKMSFPIS